MLVFKKLTFQNENTTFSVASCVELLLWILHAPVVAAGCARMSWRRGQCKGLMMKNRGEGEELRWLKYVEMKDVGVRMSMMMMMMVSN